MKWRKLEIYRRISELQIITGLKEVINRRNFDFQVRAWLSRNDSESFKNAEKNRISIDRCGINHEIIKPVSNLSIPCVDLTPESRFHGFQPGKKKKWIRFWIIWTEESWKNLVKGTQVPVARAIIIHEIKAMNPVPFSPHESHVATIVQCVQCVQCVQLFY